MPVLTDVDTDAISTARRDGYTWIDVRDPDEADVDRLAETFGLHPLAVEDTKKFGQMPKVEAYDGFVLAVAYGAKGDDLVETHLYAGDGWLLTVHRKPCVTLDHLHAGELSATTSLRVLDALTDTFFEAFDRLERDLEQLEDDIIGGSDTSTARREIIALRRETGGLRRVLPAQRDAVARGASDLVKIEGTDEESRFLLRDVQDHLERLAGRADAARDRLLQDLDMAENAQSTRLNEIGERLTLITTIFLPLTFVTGFFGMNFKWMTDHIDTFGAFVVGAGGGCVVSVGVLVAIFKRKRWLG